MYEIINYFVNFWRRGLVFGWSSFWVVYGLDIIKTKTWFSYSNNRLCHNYRLSVRNIAVGVG